MGTRSTPVAFLNERKARKSVRALLLLSSLAAGVLSVEVGTTGVALAADTRTTYEFNLPAQGIADSLRAIGQLTATNILFNPRAVGQREAPEVRGNLTADGAVERVISGMGLEMQRMRDLIVIKRVGERTSSVRTDGEEIRWAQAASSSDASPSQGEDVRKADEENSKEIQEIVVSAQRREENLQDVPISISVLSGRQLDSSTSQGLTETLRSIPGVTTLVAPQTGGSSLAVRGVAGTPQTGTGPSPIGYYLDGIPFGLVRAPFVPDVNIYDLERVEVLRGPQGTLYGASALNGVVRVLTREADLEEFELKARGLLSSTAHGGENGQADLVVNMPVVEGKLAARATASYRDWSGWIDRPTGEDHNTDESTNVRLKIAARPTEQLSIGLSAWHSEADYGAPSFSPDNRQISTPTDEPIASDFDILGLTIGYDFPGFSLTSVTSHIDYTSHNYLLSFGTTNQEILLEATTTSQEITLNSTSEGPWRWSLGGIYRDGEDRAYSDIPGLLLTPTDATLRSESHAVFGELTRSFFDSELELTGGLRYFKDQQTTREDSRPNFGLPLIPPLGVYDRPEFDAVTPRVVLNWHPDEDLTVYGSYSEGFRSGYSQGPTPRILGFPPVEPDRLRNYEVGMKAGLWNGRVNFDSALYYIDWQDVQQTLGVLIPGGSGTYSSAGVNAGSASGLGFELASTARLTDQLTLGVSYGWNDLTLDTDMSSNGIPLFFKGSRLNFSPPETASVSLSYDFPLGDTGFEGRFAMSANYLSPLQARRLVGGLVATQTGDSMLTSGISFSVNAPAGWTASLFADNISNEEGTFLAEVPRGAGRDMRPRPRTVGVQFEYRY